MCCLMIVDFSNMGTVLIISNDSLAFVWNQHGVIAAFLWFYPGEIKPECHPRVLDVV